MLLRRCSHCGLKLQLLPLHTLILVGLHLSRSGCKNETRFGILACLLCLLSYGANPLLKANFFVQALLGIEDVDECSHEEMDPVELAMKVPASSSSMWSRELSTGWQVIVNVLGHSQAEWKARPSRRLSTSSEREYKHEFSTFSEYGEDQTSAGEEASREPHLPYCPDSPDHESFFGGNKVLASLQAAVQTELLTYKRLEEGDEWISQNFNMRTLNEDLIGRGKVDIPLVQKGMMKPFCVCGNFPEACPACPTEESVAAYYFSKLEDWHRSTFLRSPDLRFES